MTVQIRDSDGTVRLSGDLLASGGATGDVLQQQADGTYAPAAASGFTPVTCLIYTPAIDIHAGGQHPLLWGTLIDNPWDYNTILAIPAGLGLTFAFNGTDATITTTTAGTWGFSLVGTFPSDAAWEGILSLDGNTQLQQSGVGNQVTPRLAVSEVVTYPSGANFVPQYATGVQATANPLNAQGFLTIVRLA